MFISVSAVNNLPSLNFPASSDLSLTLSHYPNNFLVPDINLSSRKKPFTPSHGRLNCIPRDMFLAEEFLYGLCVVVGERFYPGVGRVTHGDCLKNEIIHQLCKESMSYSELLKYVPDQDAKSSMMDDLVKEVGTFKKASPTAKGIFELKAEFVDRYSMFFYHYTRIEHSKAEDT